MVGYGGVWRVRCGVVGYGTYGIHGGVWWGMLGYGGYGVVWWCMVGYGEVW